MLRKSMITTVLLFALLCSACSQAASSAPVSSSPAPGVSSAANEPSEPEVTQTQEIAFAYPGNFTWSAPYLHTADGLYEIKAVFEGGSNIFYYDYETRTQLFLCEKPNCTHNNDGCTSWVELPPGDAFTPLLLWASDKLLLVKTAPTGSGAPYIIAMEKNGSNPQTILTLTTTQQMSNEFIGDETGLYFAIKEIDPARPQESQLVRLDVETGELKTLLALEHSNIHLAGFDREALYFETMGKIVDVYRFRPLQDSALEPVLTWDTDENGGMIIGGYAYLRYKDNTIERVNLNTLEKKTVQTIPTPENGESGLVYAFDESVLLEFLIQHETGPYTEQRYLVNTNDGTITENTLTMPSAGKPIMVIGAHGDYLCVQKDTKYTTWIEHTEDGTPMEVFDLVREYALISKNDFINDVPNYETFEAAQ